MGWWSRAKEKVSNAYKLVDKKLGGKLPGGVPSSSKSSGSSSSSSSSSSSGSSSSSPSSGSSSSGSSSRSSGGSSSSSSSSGNSIINQISQRNSYDVSTNTYTDSSGNKMSMAPENVPKNTRKYSSELNNAITGKTSSSGKVGGGSSGKISDQVQAGSSFVDESGNAKYKLESGEVIDANAQNRQAIIRGSKTSDQVKNQVTNIKNEEKIKQDVDAYTQERVQYYQDLYKRGKITENQANQKLNQEIKTYSSSLVEAENERRMRNAGIQEVYEKPLPGYYDPLSGNLVQQSIADDIAKNQGLMPVNVTGKTTSGGDIVESPTGLLTGRQTAYKNFLEGIGMAEKSEIPTTFVMNEKNKSGQKMDIKDLLNPDSYQSASRLSPYDKKTLNNINEFKNNGYSIQPGSNNDVLNRTSATNSSVSNSTRIKEKSQVDSFVLGAMKTGYAKHGIQQEQIAYADSGLNRAFDKTIGKLFNFKTTGVVRNEWDEYIKSDSYKNSLFGEVREGAYKGLADPDIQTFYKGSGLVVGAFNPAMGVMIKTTGDLAELQGTYSPGSDSGKVKAGEVAKVVGWNLAEGYAVGKVSGVLVRGGTKALSYAGTKVAGKVGERVAVYGAKGAGNVLMTAYGSQMVGESYKTYREFESGNFNKGILMSAGISAEAVGFFGERYIDKGFSKVKDVYRTRGMTKIEMPDVNAQPFYRKNKAGQTEAVYMKRFEGMKFKEPKTWVQAMQGYKKGQFTKRQYRLVAPEVQAMYEGGKGTTFPYDDPSKHYNWFVNKNVAEFGVPRKSQLPQNVRSKKGFGYSATGQAWDTLEIGEAGQYYSGKGISIRFLRLEGKYSNSNNIFDGMIGKKPIVYAGYFSDVKTNPGYEVKVPNPYDSSGKPIKKYVFQNPTQQGTLYLPGYKREVEGIMYGQRMPVRKQFYFELGGRRIPIEEQTFIDAMNKNKANKFKNGKKTKVITQPQYSYLPEIPTSQAYSNVLSSFNSFYGVSRKSRTSRVSNNYSQFYPQSYAFSPMSYVSGFSGFSGFSPASRTSRSSRSSKSSVSPMSYVSGYSYPPTSYFNSNSPLPDLNRFEEVMPKRGKRRSNTRDYEYAPSLTAVLFNIQAPNVKQKKNYSGFEIRPIVSRKRRR